MSTVKLIKLSHEHNGVIQSDTDVGAKIKCRIMEYYKGYICVTVDELTEKESGPAVMSLTNYHNLCNRKKINIVRKGGGLDNYVLIDFYSLPERFKIAIVQKYDKPEEVIKAQSKGDTVLEDTVARDFYDRYRLADGTPLDDDKIDEYTMTASILNEVIKGVNATKANQMSLGGNGGITSKEVIISMVEDFRLYPGHSLPTSWARLSAKIRDYKARGYEALVEGYLGNKNTVKITEVVGKHIVALKRSKVPQYNNEQIFEEINRIAPEKDWKAIKSVNTITAYLNRPDIMPLWYDAKYGSKAAKQKFARKHKTILPEVRDALWYGDGTKLNLYYKTFDTNGKAKMCTTQVYEVIDAFSETLIGFAISDTENYEAQYLAYRMAVETAGCRPFEVVNDNQGGHRKLKNRGFFDRIARIGRNTAPDNGSSKTIESVFGRFQHQVLSRDWRFTGMNITAKSESSRADLEFVLANQENLYTLQELKDAYMKYREVWNNAPHPETKKPRKEMYLKSINSETLPLTHTDMVDIFWEKTESAVTFTTTGITISIDKKEYTYDVYDQNGMPDLAFRNKNTNRKFVVKYDPLNMTKARLYTEDAQGILKFAAEASPYFEVRRAIQEQKPGDMEFIRKTDEMAKQNRVDNYLAMVQLEIEHGVAPEQHGLNRGKMCGISAVALERFMDKSLAKGVEQPISIGQLNKAISNTTQDQISSYDKF